MSERRTVLGKKCDKKKKPNKIDPESSVRRTRLELHSFAAFHSTEENGDLIKSTDKHCQV